MEKTAFHELSGIRQWSLNASLEALGASMDRKLVIQQTETGKISAAIIAAAKAASAKFVHATRSFDPVGIAEQNQVGLDLKAAGNLFAVRRQLLCSSPGYGAQG